MGHQCIQPQCKQIDTCFRCATCDELQEVRVISREERAVIQAAEAAPHEIKSILESLAYSPPENLCLHYARLAELANSLHEAVAALHKARE
jgi:hypothetical protein